MFCRLIEWLLYDDLVMLVPKCPILTHISSFTRYQFQKHIFLKQKEMLLVTPPQKHIE